MSDEQKLDFLKLKEVLKRIPAEYTPQQLGSLMAQYGKKWLNAPTHIVVSEPVNKYGDLDGELPMFSRVDK